MISLIIGWKDGTLEIVPGFLSSFPTIVGSLSSCCPSSEVLICVATSSCSFLSSSFCSYSFPAVPTCFSVGFFYCCPVSSYVLAGSCYRENASACRHVPEARIDVVYSSYCVASVGTEEGFGSYSVVEVATGEASGSCYIAEAGPEEGSSSYFVSGAGADSSIVTGGC